MAEGPRSRTNLIVLARRFVVLYVLALVGVYLLLSLVFGVGVFASVFFTVMAAGPIAWGALELFRPADGDDPKRLADDAAGAEPHGHEPGVDRQ